MILAGWVCILQQNRLNEEYDTLKMKQTSSRALKIGAMKSGYIEGCFAMLMLAMTEAFYIPYLNALGASPLQIGLGASLPALVSALAQLFAPSVLYYFNSRKKMVVVTVLVQASAFIPFAIACQLQESWNVWSAISAFLISAIAGNTGASAWSDWMANIIPSSRRGRYFAGRNRLLGVIQLVVSITAGLILDKTAGKVLTAFMMIWFGCFFVRTISGLILMTMYDPPVAVSKPSRETSFIVFLRNLTKNNFGRFTIATSLMSIGTNFSAPFFAIHMLNHLHLSYLQYVTVNMTATAATIVSLGLWGKLVDRFGSVILLRICAGSIVLLPAYWIFFDQFSALLLIQVLAGFSWGGFNLAAVIFYMGAIDRKQRVSSIAYFNSINFICVAAGAALGGVIGPLLPAIGKYPLLTIFMVSTILRLGPSFLFAAVKEPKDIIGRKGLDTAFSDPRVNIQTGIVRSISKIFKRNI